MAESIKRERPVLPRRERKRPPSIYDVNRGRNTKCTRLLIGEICHYLLQSLPIGKCCDLVGISEVSYYVWKEKGEAYLKNGDPHHHEIYGEFVLEVRAATAQWQLNILQQELNPTSYNPGWIKAMTMLERRDRAHWGRSDAQGKVDESSNPDTSYL